VVSEPAVLEATFEAPTTGDEVRTPAFVLVLEARDAE
jgi:hypothetical protein